MFRLTLNELLKVCKKPSFIIFTCILMTLNLFMMWYLNLPESDSPDLTSYKALSSDMSSMTEQEKYDYINKLKNNLSNISDLDMLLSLQSKEDEMSKALAAQIIAETPDIYEKYIESYRSKNYLKYTDELHKERLLAEQIYDELNKVSNYDNYIEETQNNRHTLEDISIFQANDKNNFSSKNIEKSAEDHKGLSSENIRFYPSKGTHMAMKNQLTDILLFMSVMLFIGVLVTEEKEKGLFYITRPTKNGIVKCILAKLLALLIHCFIISILMYSINLLYAGATSGLADLSAKIQSISLYIESSLSITMLQYIILSVITKALVIFCFGTALIAVSLYAAKSFVPQMAGIGWLSVNWIIYTIIPANSKLNIFKYLSVFGTIDTEHLYGGYLNLNILGTPISCLSLSIAVILIFGILNMTLSILIFIRGNRLQIDKIHISSPIPFKPYKSLLRHESYKILLTNRAIIILLVFTLLIGYRDLTMTYSPSISEQYYKDIMTSLEGELTEEKEDIITSEKNRFNEAFEQIDRIDSMVSSGKIDEKTADDMKIQWYGVLTFYPSFQRVEAQYEHVKESKGIFIYDTGYKYLFGLMDDSFLIDLLMLTLCIIFSFGNVMSMEYQKKSWNLISATVKGKRQIIKHKVAVCVLYTCAISILPWIFRIIAISKSYPMHEVMSSVDNIPAYFDFKIALPIWGFILITILSQIIVLLISTSLVLLLSHLRKSYLQSSFLALLILAVPLTISVMGIDFGKWLSIYPAYAWIALI